MKCQNEKKLQLRKIKLKLLEKEEFRSFLTPGCASSASVKMLTTISDFGPHKSGDLDLTTHAQKRKWILVARPKLGPTCNFCFKTSVVLAMNQSANARPTRSRL
jgi:hypothetical protein